MSRALMLSLACALGCAASARAQNVTFDFGLVDASGNSDILSLNLGEKLSRKFGRWVLSQSSKALYGETDGSRTTESYEINARAEYGLSARIGTFVLGVFQRDPFAGVAERWSGGPGLAVGLVRTRRDTLTVEEALTLQNERSIAGVKRDFGASRAAALFKHAFSAGAFVTQNLEWVANLEEGADYRLNSETALTAPISKQIALRLSYLIRFDNRPEPGFETTDRILTTGVQISM
jgi:putative salt-induced outer membrane protein